MYEFKEAKKILEIKTEVDFFSDGFRIQFYELDKKEVESFIFILKKEDDKYWRFSKVYPEKNMDLISFKSHLDFANEIIENDKKKKELLDLLIKKYKLLEEHKLENGYFYEKRHLGGVSDMSLYILLPEENILICLIYTT